MWQSCSTTQQVVDGARGWHGLTGGQPTGVVATKTGTAAVLVVKGAEDRPRPETTVPQLPSEPSMTSHLAACGTQEMPANLTGDGDSESQPSADAALAVSSGYVRLEELVLVVSALAVWVAAILLCVHRWGKIRMLEPYLPDYNDSTSQKGGLRLEASPALGYSRLHSPLIPMVHCRHGRSSMVCQHSQSTSRLLSHARDACALAAARKTRSADSLVAHSVLICPPNPAVL